MFALLLVIYLLAAALGVALILLPLTVLNGFAGYLYIEVSTLGEGQKFAQTLIIFKKTVVEFV